MINRLFLAKFESNMTAFITFLSMIVLMALAVLPDLTDGEFTATSSGFYAGVVLWLSIFCLAAGGIALLRHSRERHSRLYAQLPVTSLQVRVAYWYHAGLYISIASLMLLMIMIWEKGLNAIELLRFTLLFFFHTAAALAAISIVSGNALPLVPEDVRRRTVLYFFVCTLITFLFLTALGLIVASYISVLEAKTVDWSLMSLVMGGVCCALVSLDIYLFTKKQSYLG